MQVTLRASMTVPRSAYSPETNRAEEHKERTFCPTKVSAVHLLLVAVFLGAISPDSFVSAAELLPFDPPSSSRDRIADRPFSQPQLSSEDLERISKIAAQAKQLTPEDRNQLKSGIKRSLTEAAEKGNLSQVRYYGELLRQIE